MKTLTKNDLMSLEIRAASQGEQIVISRDDFEALIKGYSTGTTNADLDRLKHIVMGKENMIDALNMRIRCLEQNLKDAVSLRRNERKK